MSGFARRVERAAMDRSRKRRAAQALRAAYRAGENARAKHIQQMEPIAPHTMRTDARRKAS